jgi:hypothetical protein
MQPTPNHKANLKAELEAIAHSLIPVFAGTFKGSKLLSILKTLDACADDDYKAFVMAEIDLEDLFEGTPEFDAWVSSTDYIKTYAPFFNFNGGACHG